MSDTVTREQAMEALGRIEKDGIFSDDIDIIRRYIESPVPDGHVLTSDGTVRKVLGDKLPLTVEGDVIGDGAWCWLLLPGVKGMDDDKPARLMYRACPITDPDAYGGKRVVHSTREAALSRQGAKHGD